MTKNTKSIFDFLPNSKPGDESLDESPPEFRNIISFCGKYKEASSDILSITLTTTLKTKCNKRLINKQLPITHSKTWRQLLNEIFGNTSYFFYIDYQKNRHRLVHVHGILINEFPQYSDMLCTTITRISEKKLGANIHDIRPVHNLQGWSDYCAAKKHHDPIINIRTV